MNYVWEIVAKDTNIWLISLFDVVIFTLFNNYKVYLKL